MHLTLIIHIACLTFVFDQAKPYLPDVSEMPVPYPGVCFSPDDKELTENQDITCILATPGQYPPRQKKYHHRTRRCCFLGRAENGVFWALGETVVSPVTRYIRDTKAFPLISERVRFPLLQAHLMDILAVDASTDEVIPNARVTIADDAVHLVSFARRTDRDGYAVFPAADGSSYVVTVRADGYLTPPPVRLMYSGEENAETVVELDPGISLSGRVVNGDGHPVASAQLHVEIDRPDGGAWSSDIDRPRPVSSVTDGKGWNPYRGSYSTSERGDFKLETLPRGKLHVFASHENFTPSEVKTIDASEITTPVELVLNKGRHAYLRVENDQKIAVASTVAIIDEVTKYELNTVTTSTSGALELRNLPSRTRFLVTSNDYAPVQVVRDIKDHDEITIVLTQRRSDAVTFQVSGESNEPIGDVTISPADPALRLLHPTCIGETDSRGSATLEFCPQNFWAAVYHPDHVHALRYVTPETKNRIILSKGTDIDIRFVDIRTQAPVPNVTCQISVVHQDGGNRQVQTETAATTDGHLRLSHRPQAKHQMSCSGAPGQTVSTEFMPDAKPLKIELPHLTSRNIVVLDSLGAPVPYAMIDTGIIRSETDESGRMTLTAPPSTEFTATHWLHGNTRSHLAEGTSELEVRLPDKLDEAVISCLETHRMPYIIDSAQILLDTADARCGIARGDAVELCTAKQLAIVRDDRRLVVSCQP